VGNRYAITENGGNAATEDVNRRIVLDIDTVADANVTDIAPDNGIEPDARFLPNMHITDKVCTLLNVGAGTDLG